MIEKLAPETTKACLKLRGIHPNVAFEIVEMEGWYKYDEEMNEIYDSCTRQRRDDNYIKGLAQSLANGFWTIKKRK